MPDTPHRPFVPKRTPEERAVTRPAADFRIVRPFVHGQARSYQVEPPVISEPEPVASIADFLAFERNAPLPEAEVTVPETPPSISDYLAGDNAFEAAAYAVESDSYELPPIEHFTDTVADRESSAPEPYSASLMDPFGISTEEPPADDYGWEETDWQRYDWRAAGALGDAGDTAANSAWAQTDWGNPAQSAKGTRESAAKAIADALDGIARRIRDGDLVIPPPPAAIPDPATIAATLAALLGVRR